MTEKIIIPDEAIDAVCSALNTTRAWAHLALIAAMPNLLVSRSGWQPIETAPNGVAVLIAYDDGDVVLYKAEDNDCGWRGRDGLESIPGVSFPTHWMALPALPVQP